MSRSAKCAVPGMSSCRFLGCLVLTDIHLAIIPKTYHPVIRRSWAWAANDPCQCRLAAMLYLSYSIKFESPKWHGKSAPRHWLTRGPESEARGRVSGLHFDEARRTLLCRVVSLSGLFHSSFMLQETAKSICSRLQVQPSSTSVCCSKQRMVQGVKVFRDSPESNSKQSIPYGFDVSLCFTHISVLPRVCFMFPSIGRQLDLSCSSSLMWQMSGPLSQLCPRSRRFPWSQMLRTSQRTPNKQLENKNMETPWKIGSLWKTSHASFLRLSRRLRENVPQTQIDYLQAHPPSCLSAWSRYQEQAMWSSVLRIVGTRRGTESFSVCRTTARSNACSQEAGKEQ